jgi:hypothetical protein
MSASLLVLYGFVGLLEWALALTRTIYTIRHNMIVVPITVLLETFVAMIVFKNFIITGDLAIAGSYAVGSAFGSLIPMLCTKRKHEGDNGERKQA